MKTVSQQNPSLRLNPETLNAKGLSGSFATIVPSAERFSWALTCRFRLYGNEYVSILNVCCFQLSAFCQSKRSHVQQRRFFDGEDNSPLGDSKAIGRRGQKFPLFSFPAWGVSAEFVLPWLAPFVIFLTQGWAFPPKGELFFLGLGRGKRDGRMEHLAQREPWAEIKRSPRSAP